MGPFSQVPGLAGYQQQVALNDQSGMQNLGTIAQLMKLQKMQQDMQYAPEDRVMKVQMQKAQMGNYEAEAADRNAKAQKMSELFNLSKQISVMPQDHPDRPMLVQRYKMLADPNSAFAPPAMPKMRERIEGGKLIQEEYQPDGTFKKVGEGERFAKQVAPIVQVGDGSKKPAKLPAVALKMQQEELDAIGIASSIQSDLASILDQIDKGELNLSLAGNLASKAKNFVGKSDSNSRNFASFQATLEKMRNDSLRLNKGVQTEGDAVRAWNELFANINDQGVVKKRLSEIQRINERASSLRVMNIDKIRSNYGAEPLDLNPYISQPPAIGGATATGKGGNKNITVDW